MIPLRSVGAARDLDRSWSRRSDGGLGEGHTEVVVLSQVVVVELSQGLDCLLHCGHLDQGHLAVFSRLREHSL